MIEHGCWVQKYPFRCGECSGCTTDPKPKPEAQSPGFNITSNKGFQITFENGWIVSVQWGPGNHCANYGKMELDPKATNDFKCLDAEVEIHHSAMEGFLEFPGTKPDGMAKIMQVVMGFNSEFVWNFDRARWYLDRAM